MAAAERDLVFPADVTPTDTVSSLSWSPVSNHIVGASWDFEVRCWAVSQQLEVAAVASTKHAAPVLDVCWSPDGQNVFTGSCDQTGLMWNLETNQTTQVAAHDAPIRSVFFEPTLQCLVTGGWDRKVRFWDCRAQAPVFEHTMPERIRSMSSVHPLAVVLCTPTADKKSFVVLDLNMPDKIFRVEKPHFDFAPTVVCCTLDQAIIIGSVEGRVAVHFADPAIDAGSMFAFKTHRVEHDVYAVNAISLNPYYNSFTTAGQDGSIASWDHKGKLRINYIYRPQPNTRVKPAPVTATAFNAGGDILAFATGYDWGKGAAGFDQTMGTQIFLHPCIGAEIDPSQAKLDKGGGRGRTR
eukprot:a762_29.p1 GENE.a762_29~~a762_29.p1  ORF type:complete len:362 (-),score=99.96 a762_29:462-1520(-)